MEHIIPSLSARDYPIMGRGAIIPGFWKELRVNEKGGETVQFLAWMTAHPPSSTQCAGCVRRASAYPGRVFGGSPRPGNSCPAHDLVSQAGRTFARSAWGLPFLGRALPSLRPSWPPFTACSYKGQPTTCGSVQSTCRGRTGKAIEYERANARPSCLGRHNSYGVAPIDTPNGSSGCG